MPVSGPPSSMSFVVGSINFNGGSEVQMGASGVVFH